MANPEVDNYVKPEFTEGQLESIMTLCFDEIDKPDLGQGYKIRHLKIIEKCARLLQGAPYGD